MSIKETRSTCPYCGVGCGVIIQSEGAQITGVRGDPDHPANFGKLCTKGSTLHLTATPAVNEATRLLQPMLRASRQSEAEPCGWDTAIETAADRFANIIKEHGPDAVGVYVSGQLLTEDYYVFNKLVKGLIGTNNIDTNSRLCMSSAVAGYKKTLGADAPPACYDDVNHASTIFIVGSNAAWAHPVLFRRIEEARKNNPALKLVVCDPRKTETALTADVYLPLLPGTDVMLFHGMLHIMLWEGWLNNSYIERHTEGFDALKATVREYTPAVVAKACGVTEADLFKATEYFAKSPATLSLYCQGLTQSSSGTAKNAALINLHLATGQIGKPGAGPFSLTGQPNAMGGREVGGLANLLSAHRDLANPEHRAEVARLWSVEDVPAKPGKTAVEMFEAAANGEIKALWIACTNPAQSMPDQTVVRRALERAEFVVVQEAYASTATCDYADLLLPATTWGEKTGTVTNSERRISRVRTAVPAAGLARHDWAIAIQIGKALETRLRPNQPTLFPYPVDDAEAAVETIWNEHRESTWGRDLDITGLSYRLLDEIGPQQWPMPDGATHGKIRLYEDGHFPTPSGRARFANVAYQATAEKPESRYPFSLTTGRLRDHWHGMSRTGTLGRLFGHTPEPSVELNPRDMQRMALKDGDLVTVSSKRGTLVIPATASDETAPSQAFIGMHWGSEYLSGLSGEGLPIAGVNAITTSSFCPDSKQPELKHAAVKVFKASLPWSLLAMAWLPEASVLPTQKALRQWMQVFPFASCVPFSSRTTLDNAHAARHGVLFRAAGHEAAPAEAIAAIEALLGLDTPQTIRYTDLSKGHHRSARLQREGNNAHLEAVLLAGDTSSESWIKSLLQDSLPAEQYGRAILLANSKAPVEVEAKAALVCTCLNVDQRQIDAVLKDTTGTEAVLLATLQNTLQCGTNCGSCVPSLKKTITAHCSKVGSPAAHR